MSAAAPTRPKRKAAPGYTRIAHYVLRAMPRYCNPTEFVCLLLVLYWTIGWGREWADVSVEQFMAATGKSRRWVEETLSFLLESATWLEWRRGKPRYDHGKPVGHRDEYRLNLRFDLDSKKFGRREDPLYAKCSACQTDGPMEPDHGHCPVPPKFIRHVPRTVSPAAYLCLCVILDETAGWNQERAQIKVDDICRDTGLERRAVQGALAELQALEFPLIGEESVPGEASWYWVLAENFGKNSQRPARTVAKAAPADPSPASAPSTSEETTNKEPPKEPEAVQNPWRRRAFEFVGRAICKCRSCGIIGPVEVASDEVGGRSIPVQTPNGGARAPTGAGPPPKPAANGENNDVASGREELYAWLAGWRGVMGELPGPAALSAIAAALEGAPSTWLEAECRAPETHEYIRQHGRSYKLFCVYAKKAAYRWKLAEVDRHRAEEVLRQREAEQPEIERAEAAAVEARREQEQQAIEAARLADEKFLSWAATADIDAVKEGIWMRHEATDPVNRRRRGVLKARLRELEAACGA